MKARARIQSHPLHPILVCFPLGLWVSGFAFDLLGNDLNRSLLWAAGYYALVGGIAGALLAAAAGAIDLFSVVPPQSSARMRGLQHAALNLLALLLFAFIAWRRGGPETRPDTLALIMAGAGVLILGISGWLGGTLVYRNQIGVDHRYARAGKWRERTLPDWDQPVCKTDDLENGQMMLVHIDGLRIAIAKCEDEFWAFQDRCTHKGGPLADGVLIGCTVQCPWHGSNFNTHNGHVEAGPAEKKIATYKCETRKNEVFIRPRKK